MEEKIEKLENALREAISSAVSDVACDENCNYFTGVIDINVEDGWTNVEVSYLKITE